MRSKTLVRFIVIGVCFFGFVTFLLSSGPDHPVAVHDVPGVDMFPVRPVAEKNREVRSKTSAPHEVDHHTADPALGVRDTTPEGPRSLQLLDSCEVLQEHVNDGVVRGVEHRFAFRALQHGIMSVTPLSYQQLSQRKLFFADDALVVDMEKEAVALRVLTEIKEVEGLSSSARSLRAAMRGRKIEFEHEQSSDLLRYVSAACALQPRLPSKPGRNAPDDEPEVRKVIQFQYCRTSTMIGNADFGESSPADGSDHSSLISPPCLVDLSMAPIHNTAGMVRDFASAHQSSADRVTAGTFTFKRRVSFYGLAMRGDGFKLSDAAQIKMKNLDINHYVLNEGLGLYGSVPLVYAVDDVHPHRHTVGIFWLSGATVEVQTQKEWDGSRISFMSSEGGVRIFVLPGPTPADVLRQYLYLTGKPMLPPVFSIGYHQCRWSYRNQRDVLEVNRGFDDNLMPCDAIWLDIDHTNGKRYFTWDRRLFPDPKSMQESVWRDSGRRMVTITDPHIKVDIQYRVYADARKKGLLVRTQDGTNEFRGHCWPGESTWIDFYNPEAREFYASMFEYGNYEGSTPTLFAWNDMNEPSVFSGPEITLPMSVKHYDGTNHGQLHNMYGFYQSMSTFLGHLRRSKNEARPFSLTRSFFAGSQRFAAVWTGDNQAKWSHLKVSITMVLQMSICGIPFVGADVGGFFDEPPEELLLRWYQLGSLYPFFRGHSHEQTRRREPWLSVKKDGIRKALRLRYQLLPYLYTAFWEAHRFGDAVWRPLLLAFPHDVAGTSVTDTFMVGSSLLARPVVEMAQTAHEVSVHFPLGGRFYDWWTGDAVESSPGSRATVPIPDLDSDVVVPMWIRAGKIVVVKSDVGKSSENHGRFPYNIVVALDERGRAEGHLYVDDQVSNDFAGPLKKFCVVRLRYELATLFVETSTDDANTAADIDGAQGVRHCNFDPASEDAPHIVGSIKIFSGHLHRLPSARVVFVAKGSDFTSHGGKESAPEGNSHQQGASIGPTALRRARDLVVRVLSADVYGDKRRNPVIEVNVVGLKLPMVPPASDSEYLYSSGASTTVTTWVLKFDAPESAGGAETHAPNAVHIDEDRK